MGCIHDTTTKMKSLICKCELCVKGSAIQRPLKQCKVCDTMVNPRNCSDCGTAIYKQGKVKFVRMKGSCLL